MSTFITSVKKGIEGLNTGIYGGLPRFDKLICNTQKGWIYTIAGNSGSGKSAFVLYHQILVPWMNGSRNIKWFFYSLEMGKDQVIARLVSFFCKHKYNIVLSPPVIMGFTARKLTATELKMVEKIYTDEIEPLLQHLTIITDRRDSNPTGIRNYMTNYARQNGTIHYESYTVEDKGGVKRDKQRIVGYTPNNSNEHVQIIIDHCILMSSEQGFGKKQNIDKWVDEYARDFANLYNYTIVNVAQLNRAISDHTRVRDDGSDLMPQTSDIMETSSFEQSSDIVIALFNPNAYKRVKSHQAFKLEDWKGKYRCLRLMKARHVPFPKTVPVLIHGESCDWQELPHPDDKTAINNILKTII